MATIFDENGIASTFSDFFVSPTTTKKKLEDPDFMESIQILFYVKEERFTTIGHTTCANKRPDPTNWPWHLDEIQIQRVNALWKGESKWVIKSSLVNVEDILTLSSRQLVNEICINAFINVVCGEVPNISVRTAQAPTSYPPF